MIVELSPGLILILGALLVALLGGRLRDTVAVALPILALLHAISLPHGDAGEVEVFGMALTTLRVDGLSLLFGCALLVGALIVVVYALHLPHRMPQVATLIHAGAAVGAVFAGDLYTLFVYWVIAVVASVFLIWASRSEASYRAGMRYLLIQGLAALLLFEGALILSYRVGDVGFDAVALETTAYWMVFAAIAIAGALPLLHAWLPDAYARATPTGSVVLSLFMTKVALYALVRGFGGAEFLMPIGIIMALFALVYAAMEPDLRRMLGYVLISQLGVMVIGVGLGGDLALAGVAVYAVGHTLFIALLFMAVGALAHRAGDGDFLDILPAMPSTARFAAFGILSIAAPLTAGFGGQTLLAAAALESGHVGAWVALVAAAGGAIAVLGLRLVWPALSALRARSGGGEELPGNMQVAMGIAALAGIAVGLVPGALAGQIAEGAATVYTPASVVAQLQLVAFAALAVALTARLGWAETPTRATLIDVDWVYRRAGRAALPQALAVGRRVRGGLLAVMFASLDAALAVIYRHLGPHGILARNWPTGAMAFWTTVLLAVWLVAYYL